MAVGGETAGPAWATSLLKAREALPMIFHVHADVHGPNIGLNFHAETLSTAVRPTLSDRWLLHPLRASDSLAYTCYKMLN